MKLSHVLEGNIGSFLELTKFTSGVDEEILKHTLEARKMQLTYSNEPLHRVIADILKAAKRYTDTILKFREFYYTPRDQALHAIIGFSSDSLYFKVMLSHGRYGYTITMPKDEKGHALELDGTAMLDGIDLMKAARRLRT